MYLIIKACT